MNWEKQVLHDVKGVRRFAITFDGDDLGWEAITGVGYMLGCSYYSLTWNFGVLGVMNLAEYSAESITRLLKLSTFKVDASKVWLGAATIRYCDDIQIIASYMAGLPWLEKEPALWDRSNNDFLPSLDWGRVKQGEVKVLSPTEAKQYIVTYNILHPSVPLD